MIKTKKEYFEYLEKDKIANGKGNKKIKFIYFLGLGENIWIFLIFLRTLEYIKNCKKNLYWKLIYRILYFMFTKQSMKLGFSIPINVLGPGVSLPHRGTIVIHSKAKIGKNARIHVCVNIGAYKGKAPILGDNIYIAPGAKIFGEIKIANNIAIGANAVVNKSFEEENITIGGVPASKINNNGSEELIPNYDK
jgi:serine O-acetyltransferase